MTAVRIILVPYHAGVRNERVGRGPGRLIEDGLADELAQCGFACDIATIPPVDDFEGEIGKSFELIRRVSSAVSEARAGGELPIVLAGNCNTTNGVWAGMDDSSLGVIWFDAHPDFDTPEEHRSGYFDGMGASTLTGQCWKNMAATVPGFRPLAMDRLLYCGIRDFEPGQAERVRDHGVAAVIGSTEHETDYVAGFSDALANTKFDRAIVHIDLDCLDTKVGRANEYAAPGGLTAQQLVECMRLLRERVTPAAVTVASFNPDFEGAERISAAGRAAVLALLG
jgi:arginase